MQIKFWVSAILLAANLSTAGQTPVVLASGGALTYSASGPETVFTIWRPHRGKSQLRVKRDVTVAQDARPTSVRLVAEVAGSIIILTDTYPSIPGGMAFCQAGEESFLRVIKVSGKRPVETYHLKLESCRDDLELVSPGIEWSQEKKTLYIHWLSGPGQAGKPENRRLTIGREGRISS